MVGGFFDAATKHYTLANERPRRFFRFSKRKFSIFFQNDSRRNSQKLFRRREKKNPPPRFPPELPRRIFQNFTAAAFSAIPVSAAAGKLFSESPATHVFQQNGGLPQATHSFFTAPREKTLFNVPGPPK